MLFLLTDGFMAPSRTRTSLWRRYEHVERCDVVRPASQLSRVCLDHISFPCAPGTKHGKGIPSCPAISASTYLR